MGLFGPSVPTRTPVVFPHRDTDRCEFSPSKVPYTPYLLTGMLKRKNRLLHLPLPNWLSVWLEWYKTEVRPLLNATAENVAKYFEKCNLEIAEHNRLCPQQLVMSLPQHPCTNIHLHTSIHTSSCMITHEVMMIISATNITAVAGLQHSSGRVLVSTKKRATANEWNQ
jgi:hypothetical protein